MCFDTISLHDENTIVLELEALLHRLPRACIASNEDSTTLSNWRIFALNEIYSTEDKKRVIIPSREQLRHFLTFGHIGEKLEWTDIHLLAQMQAVFYSLRVLAQLLNVASLGTSITEKVQNALVNLPPLRALMKSRSEIMRERNSEVVTNSLVDRFLQMQEQVGQPIDESDENLPGGFGQGQEADSDVRAWSVAQAMRNRLQPDSGGDKLVKRQKANMYELLVSEE